MMCVGCFFMEIFFARETKKEYGHTRNREKKEKKKGAVSSLFYLLSDNTITKINQ